MAHRTGRWFSFWLLLATCGVSCSDDDSSSSEPAGNGSVLPETTVLMGRVLDIDGKGISGVSVQGGDAKATSSGDGSFEVDAEPGSSVVVTLDKDGYLRGIKRVDVLEDTPTALEVVLVREADAVTLDADTGGAVQGTRGASLEAPPQAFVDQDGATVSGDVDVHLTPLDPSVDAELAAYPGDLRALTVEGDPAQLETFGVLDVTVRKDGEDLQIADGQSVEIQIPAPSAGVETPPETVGLWSFDPDSGEWVEEGTLDYDAKSGTYGGTISHLSPWNADQQVDATAVGGTVLDDQGRPVPGAWIDARGVDYLGAASATADEDGVFCVVVRKDSVVQIRVIHPLGGGTTLEIDTGSSDTSIPPESGDCTDQGTWVIEQGTLTDSEGEQTDCSTLNVPYEGTCAEDMTDMFVCFDPQGACSYDMAAGEISYANGAKMTTTGLQSELYGADGTFCASMSTEIDTAGLAMTTYTDANGESWVLTYDEQGDETIECPNGESIMLTSEQMTALQACSGTGASSGDSASGDDSCEIVGGGMSGVTQCTDTSDCASGEVCCPSVGYCLPDIEGICDA